MESHVPSVGGGRSRTLTDILYELDQYYNQETQETGIAEPDDAAVSFDDISNPIHYNGDGEVPCKRAMKSMLSVTPEWMSHETSYWWTCALKYIWRWPNKNRIKDLLKAKQSIAYAILSAQEDLLDRSWTTSDDQQ